MTHYELILRLVFILAVFTASLMVVHVVLSY